MRYLILGAGAIGGGIGGRLAEVGLDVTLIARGRHLDALRRDGLTLATPYGESRPAVRIADSVAAAEASTGDVIMLATKSQDTESALDAIDAAGVRGLEIGCAQNGVANEAMAARRGLRVHGMRVFVRASHLQAGVVRLHTAPVFGVIDVGRYPDGLDDSTRRIASDLATAGFDAAPSERIMRLKYAKLVGNLGNALNAACGQDSRRSALLVEAASEATACFAAAGIDVAPADESAERIERLLGQADSDTAYPGSSSWQSLARGGRLEANWLNGEVSLLGLQHGVATPVNDAMRVLAEWLWRTGAAPGSVSLDVVETWIAGGGIGYPGLSTGSRVASTRAIDRR